LLLILQSKKGGLAAWEPAGAQEWLEVSVTLHQLVMETYLIIN